MLRSFLIISLLILSFNSNAFATKPMMDCTMDAKVCADGSFVSRHGPNCEFALCPNKKEHESNDKEDSHEDKHSDDKHSDDKHSDDKHGSNHDNEGKGVTSSPHHEGEHD